MSTRLERRVVIKTSAYTVDPTVNRPGTVFTNRGATGSVTFTLPAPSTRLRGWFYTFRAIADYAIVVAAATAGTLVTLNDVAANSLAASTASEIIGAEIEVFCDGTAWSAEGRAVGHTYTIAT